LHQSPKTYGQKGTRWKLSSLLAACKWLRLGTLQGLWQLLRRLKIHWKRAREHVHSPDPDYVEKLHSIRCHLLEAGDGKVFLFQDEFTFYRHPSLAWAYELAGKTQPLAELGWKGNYFFRISATLDAWTGKVVYEMKQKFRLSTMVKFYQKVATAYPQADEIGMAQDNWPVHFHPDVLAALHPQELLWPVRIPGNWPTQPSSRAKRLNLPISVFPLPTYASWNNPIEKLWRLLKQDVLHLHNFADDWSAQKSAVAEFLDQFAEGSNDLLRYVGLANPLKIYLPVFYPSARSAL
jgi:hypothetical protein